MIIKKSTNRKKEFIFLIGGSVMIVLFIIYIIFVIRSIASRANIIFGNEDQNLEIISFDFERYNEVIERVFPSSTISQETKNGGFPTSTVDQETEIE